MTDPTGDRVYICDNCKQRLFVDILGGTREDVLPCFKCGCSEVTRTDEIVWD